MSLIFLNSLRTDRPRNHGIAVAAPLLLALAGWFVWNVPSIAPRYSGDIWVIIPIIGVPLSVAYAAYVTGHVLVAYGFVPVLVAWTRKDRVWVGTFWARFSLSRKKLMLDPKDTVVSFLDSERPQPALGHIYYPTLASGGRRILVRTFGVIDEAAIVSFLRDSLQMGSAQPIT